MDKSSPISDYYRGKTVLLTGVTGFLGQCFLVKLLRIGAKTVYILIRQRKDQSVQERYKRLIESPIFEKLKEERPNFADDIVPICGLLDEIELNISQDDQLTLFRNVEIIIHSAADIRFDVPITIAALRNIRGTRELLLLARKMENFQNFVYISTAYAFCFRDVTGEEFYRPPIDSKAIINIAEKMTSVSDRDTIDAVCSQLITPWPNTYTFSKAIAESLVQEYRQFFKITIVRPSIVTATIEEPIEGWNTNFAGVNGVISGVSCGVLRCLLINGATKLDMVCGDYVINATLAAAYDVSNGSTLNPIYNIISGNDYVVTVDRLLKSLIPFRVDSTPGVCMWYPFLIYCRYDFTYFIYNIILHAIPAFAVDSILKTLGKKQRTLKIYRQLQTFGDALRLFLLNSFKFENSNMKRISTTMTSKDKQIFPCDFSKIIWSEYKDIYYYKGIVTSLLKENVDRTKMRKHSNKMFVLHYGFITLFSLSIAMVLWLLFFK